MSEHDIALVTGANKGIGFEIAAGLAAKGLTVLLACRDRGRGESAAERLRDAGGDAHALVLDVTSQATVDAAVTDVGARFGRLDVLVNNAGMPGDLAGQVPGSARLDVIERVFATNVLGVVRVTEAMLPLLRGSAAGRIVNVSSGVGSLGNMTDPGHYMSALPAMLAYPSSKSALNAVTVQYAKALRGEGIAVNAVAPGACDTDFTRPFGMAITRTAAQGAAIAVRLSLGEVDGTGGFADDDGEVRW